MLCSESKLGGRAHKRLAVARENGYLDGRCRNSREVVEAYGLWCWRLKIPCVWFRRQTPRSKYGRIRVEMFTTANMLTVQGQVEVKTLCAASSAGGREMVSPHDVCCDRVPLRNLDQLAHSIFRATTRNGNYEPNRPKLLSIDSRKSAKLFKLEPPRAVSA